MASILKAEDISLPGTVVNAADYAEVLIELAEVNFLLSEARGWTQADYIAGVRASLEKWGISGAAADTYVNALPAANQANVLSQKYLALYMQGIEAWSEIRRTGYPTWLIKPGDVVWPDVPSTEAGADKFTPLVGTAIPARLYYPQKEQAVNLDNYRAALQAQGGDNLATKVWWNK